MTANQPPKAASPNDTAVEAAYVQACEFSRHYSQHSISVRLACIVQGLAVLSGGGYLALQQHHLQAAAAGAFGVLLAVILYRLHRGYYLAADAFARACEELEQALELAHLAPMSRYGAVRQIRFETSRSRIVGIHGVFTLVSAACAGLAVYSLWNHLSAP